MLKRLAETYVVGVFTAAEKIYAEKVLKLLDPYSNIFSIKLFREHCS
jgi:TFIIF-interacting CTD phosphatase-like protein